jgi:hypothetical protein
LMGLCYPSLKNSFISMSSAGKSAEIGLSFRKDRSDLALQQSSI